MRLYERMTNSIAVILLVVTALFCACEKTDEQTGEPDGSAPRGRCLLEAPLIGVVPFGGGSAQTRAALQMEEQLLAFNTGEELGNIITLGNSEVEDTLQTRADDGIYYRIVVYTLEEWNKAAPKILEQRLCKTGSTTYVADLRDSTEPIYLNTGDYRIFCYSFNKTTTDKMAKLADGAVNVPLSDGDDFLSADVISQNIVASQLGTNVALGTITLKHRCCRLIGTLKAEGFPTATGIAADPVPSYSVTSTFSKEGNWSIKSASISTTTTAAESKSFALTKSGNDYIGTFLVLPLTSQSLKVTYTFKPNGASTPCTASNKQASASTTFSSGGSYDFVVKAIGAYVPSTESPVIFGGIPWAPTNLNYDKTLESKPWVSGKLNGSDNDYWRWNVKNVDTSTSAGPAGATWDINNDPCRAGLGSPWRVPSRWSFNALVNRRLQNKKVYINGTTAMTNSYGWVESGNVIGYFGFDSETGAGLFLPAAGRREGSSVGSSGVSGNYWGAEVYYNDPDASYFLYFSATTIDIRGSQRQFGRSLRCTQ